MATLTAVRTGLYETLFDRVQKVNAYRSRQKHPQYPCAIVGMPNELDLTPDQGTARDLTVPVWVGVEWGDDESSDELLETCLEDVIAAITADSTLGGRVSDLGFLPVTDFGEALTDDNRTVMWCSVPVTVLA